MQNNYHQLQQMYIVNHFIEKYKNELKSKIFCNLQKLWLIMILKHIKYVLETKMVDVV
jgi:hypothetical protein